MSARLILAFALAACSLQAAEPLRVVILSRLTQSLPEGLKLFEARHGAGRIALFYGDAAAPPPELDSAHVVVSYNLHSEAARALAPRIRPLLARRVPVLAHWPEGAARHWGLAQDPARLQPAIDYFSYGGPENMARLLAYLHTTIAARPGVPVLPPEPQLTTGIYHPASSTPFSTLDAYLRWHAAHLRLPPDAPKAAILFYHTNLKNKDLAHIDSLTRALERRGILPIPVFGWPPTLCEPLLTGPDGPVPDIVFALNLGFAKPDDAQFLARLDAHVIGLLVTRQSRAEWLASPHGVQSSQLALQLAAPERAGATEPITVAATERAPDGKSTVTLPIDERIDAAVRRAARWIHLRRAPNAEKKIALLYYNNPPGAGNISASYLNVPGSLANLIRTLRDDGYLTGPDTPSESVLLSLLQRSGRNTADWDPAELESLVRNGRLTLISIPQYRQWARQLPPEFLRQVEKAWGPPEASTLMTIRTRDGKPFFVLPGLRLGNLFLGPQPLRASLQKAAAAQHDTALPPPHSYLAAYLWLRHHFQADSIVHVGRHGTLEFLPGKNTGQAGHDASEAILGDIPAPYFYITDGGGESITARRRGSATIISHLTPLLAPAGPQAAFRPLQDALANYFKTLPEAPALAAQYETSARAEIRRLHLHTQLALRLDTDPFPETARAVEDFLHNTESAAIPLGVHTLGVLPRQDLQDEALAEFRRLGATEDAARQWLADLHASPPRELSQFLRVLRGRYLESGPSGDPLRAPAVLPTGRNLHDLDPSLIPTPAACALGRKLADTLLANLQRQTGQPARKVSLVLWYGETVRHQGAMECQALHLMGVEPRWNARGVLDDLRLIPQSELGRPRVDVVITIAGIYRDGFPDKALLLDRASRLVQQSGDNPLAENTRAAAEALRQRGLSPADALRAASARVFGPAPGDYGGGVARLAKQGSAGVADAYLRHNNHAFTAEAWGEVNPHSLATHLAGNQAIVHSRATNLYGLLDNDDFFDFAGGLSAATASVNHGKAPELYVANLRRPGQERLEDFRHTLSAELHGRIWNPKWIREMQRSGYAGAREISDHFDNISGWQSTTPDKIDPSVWKTSYEIYVEDKYNLGLKSFFSKTNPHARRALLTRLLQSAPISPQQKAALQSELTQPSSNPNPVATPTPTPISAPRAAKPFRLFRLPPDTFPAIPPVAPAQLGALAFLLFFLASLALGALRPLLPISGTVYSITDLPRPPSPPSSPDA